MELRMSLAPESISEIAQLAGFAALLEPEVQAAMQEGAKTVAEAAQAKTWEVFDHPTGDLAGTIEPETASPFEVQVVVGSPYGHRREVGFSGQTDSLGRFYADDPAKPYLAPALAEHEQDVLLDVENAVADALDRVGGG